MTRREAPDRGCEICEYCYEGMMYERICFYYWFESMKIESARM